MFVGVSMFPHQVGGYNGGTSADAGHAVHQNSSFFPTFLDEEVGRIEELREVKPGLVFRIKDEVAVNVGCNRG